MKTCLPYLRLLPVTAVLGLTQLAPTMAQANEAASQLMTTVTKSEKILELESLANEGDAHACFRLGYSHANGLDTPRDNAKAIEWFKQGAAVGNSSSMACLGAMAWGGCGMHQDYTVAREWLTKAIAAKGGNTWAPYMLGLTAENGQGGHRDLDVAAALYRSAAEQGFYKATFRCNLLHAAGFNEMPTFKEDPQWILKSAAGGEPGDQFLLGLMYLQGGDVEKNEVEALVWLTAAADFGLPAAIDQAKDLRSRLTLSEIEIADARIKVLRENQPNDQRPLF